MHIKRISHVIISAMTNSNRIKSIDISKCLLILLVLIGHRTGGQLHSLIYSFHMPAFYILSGIVMKKRSKSIDKTLIYYLFFSLILILYEIVINIINLNTIVIYNVFTMTYITVVLYGIEELWFLGSLMIGKQIVNQIEKINNTIIKTLIIVLLYAISMKSTNYLNLFMLDTVFEQCAFYAINSILRAFYISVYIFIGYELKKYFLKFCNTMENNMFFSFLSLIISIVVLACFIPNQMIDIHLLSYGDVGLNIISSIIGLISVLSLSTILSKSQFNNYFCWAGSNTIFIMFLEYFKLDKYIRLILHINNQMLSNVITYALYLLIINIFIKFITPVINKIIDNAYKKWLNTFSH